MRGGGGGDLVRLLSIAPVVFLLSTLGLLHLAPPAESAREASGFCASPVAAGIAGAGAESAVGIFLYDL